MNTDYTVDYFINKFEEIPEENFYEGGLSYNNAKCVAGHCGVTRLDIFCEYVAPVPEFDALYSILSPLNTYGDSPYEFIYSINDKSRNQPYKQPTPKQRILAALYDIKANQAIEEAKNILSSESLKQTV